MIDEVFTYLAVAESRQFFAIITPHMLSKCKQELYNVCPSDVVLRTAGESTLLIVLFLGKEEIVLRKCKRLVLNGTFEPIWIRSPDSNYWIYSLSTPQRVTVQCQERGSPPTLQSSYQLALEGTGVLLNSSSCYIRVYAKCFKLLPHSLGKTIVNLTKTHIVLPNIDNVLNLQEEGLFQPDILQPLTLQRLDGIIERATSRGYTRSVDANKITTMLRDSDVHYRP
jgi:hypothetical protein